ncbi:hypothetical protein ASG61_20830 [Bacillus sp. Leaf75]|nr:hypothetical protein ASG61_20830 [Bacillus sp. Leaf75]
MNKLKKHDSIEEIFSEKLGLPDLVSILSEAPPYWVTPILIKAAKERTSKITPQELLRIYDAKPDFYGVSFLEQRQIVKFQSAFYSVLPKKFESVELSPISPLGTNSVLSNISQDKVMSTTRNSEVVGDPTTSLILEAASRRKKLAKKEETLFKTVELATFHRVLRMQPFDKTKGYMQQFNLLGVTTASRENKYEKFIFNVMLEHIELWINFTEHLNCSGYSFKNISVKISNTQILENIINVLSLSRETVNQTNNEDFNLINHFNLNIPSEVLSMNEINSEIIEQYNLEAIMPQMLLFEERVLEPLKNKYPNIDFCFDFNRILGLGYYRDFCFHIFATNKDGRNVQLSDGGSVDYIEKLLSDKKEYAITSGFGAELIQKLFMNKRDSY